MGEDLRLARAAAVVFKALSEHVDFIERAGATKDVKRKILECGQLLQDERALKDLRRAGRNLLRIH